MKLRTQILLFLFLFALAPLLLLVSITMPVVLDRIEDLYHRAYLQNLRADFRDLDQHIASRQEMLRLLAKLPEPGILMEPEGYGVEEIDEARATYVEWTNRILDDQLDVARVVFTDRKGHHQFWLERDPGSLLLRPTLVPPPALPRELVDAGLSAQPRSVVISPIRVDREGGPFNFLTLNLAIPVVLEPGTDSVGLVYITVDVGGMARAYAQTLWVHDDGSYLQHPQTGGIGNNAFKDFPGLEQEFATKRLALWEAADGRQTIWVPMFATDDDGILWVGRAVDPSPLVAFQRVLVLRGLIVVIIVVLVIWMLASWFAGRAARFGDELTAGIGQMLEDRPVSFGWRGTQEFRELGENLTKLADIHARNTRNLRVHTRELEASNRYKSEFLANVSHELRTPLNSILLLSKLLAGKAHLTHEERQQAEVIHRAGQDLRELIDNILDLSRIEAGETVFTPEPLELRQLLEDLLEMVRPQFEAKGLYLELVVDDDAPMELVSDGGKVRQIVKNFLSNAVKFTEHGGTTVRLARNGLDASARPVRIDVTDSGIGIPVAKQKVIFEAFKQAEGSINRRYGGTGLGLSISRGLAHLLGGEISLHSVPGQGATFSLCLPSEFTAAPQSTELREEPPGVEEDEGAPPAADFSGHTVLVVERDLGQMLRLAPLLESWKIRVVGAADLEEAIEVLDDDPECQTVLLHVDDAEPGTCATIQNIGQHAGSEGMIILMAEDCGSADRLPCATPMVRSCIPLPADPARVREVLDECLGRKAVNRKE